MDSIPDPDPIENSNLHTSYDTHSTMCRTNLKFFTTFRSRFVNFFSDEILVCIWAIQVFPGLDIGVGNS